MSSLVHTVSYDWRFPSILKNTTPLLLILHNCLDTFLVSVKTAIIDFYTMPFRCNLFMQIF